MSRPRARSRNSARAVRKMTGISLVESSSSSCSATRQPSSAGIITSRRMTSGRSLRACSRPDGPSLASSTSMPSASRLTRQRSRIGASSSITSTRVTKPSPVACQLYPRSFLFDKWLRRRGHVEDELRALALLRPNGHVAAHRGDQPLCDEETEAGARARVAPAIELPEDPLLLGLRNPDALVLDGHLDRVARGPRGDRHGS